MPADNPYKCDVSPENEARSTVRLGKLGVAPLCENREINSLDVIDELFPKIPDVGF